MVRLQLIPVIRLVNWHIFSAVYINNHSAVWGSFYDLNSGQWAYACCHSTIPGSFCTGEAGIEANKASSASNLLKRKKQEVEPITKSLADQHLEKLATKGGEGEIDADRVDQSALSRKKRVGEGDLVLDKDKLDRALKDERKRKSGKREEWEDDVAQKKGKYDVTEEEMEAYRMAKTAGAEDPMANYVDEEDM